jgi:antitoxin (DNA-binding transcriptional repressor) of toxin-antitoxin stability system
MFKRTIHVSEAQAASELPQLLERIREGSEVIIEHESTPVAVLRPPEVVPRTTSEVIALLPKDSAATIDSDFAKDLEAAILSRREPLKPPEWD